MDLTNQRIAITLKENQGLKIITCVPINNPASLNDFINIEMDMQPDHVLFGNVVYHLESENSITVELEEPSISVELDLDLFDYAVVEK